MNTMRRTEVTYHIPRTLIACLFGGAAMMLIGLALVALVPKAVANWRSAEVYLDMRRIEVDSATHCVTVERATPHHADGLKVQWIAELVSPEGREYCSGNGVSLIQKKPHDEIRMQITTYVGDRACKAPVGEPLQLYASYRFSVHGVQKDIAVASEVFTLDERRGSC